MHHYDGASGRLLQVARRAALVSGWARVPPVLPARFLTLCTTALRLAPERGAVHLGATHVFEMPV